MTRSRIKSSSPATPTKKRSSLPPSDSTTTSTPHKSSTSTTTRNFKPSEAVDVNADDSSLAMVAQDTDVGDLDAVVPDMTHKGLTTLATISRVSGSLLAGISVVAPVEAPQPAQADSNREVTAQDVRDACVSPKTQRAYRGSLRVISRWTEVQTQEDAAEYFDAKGQINLDKFTAVDFEEFLLGKRKSVSVGTSSGYRSATKDLYRRNEIPLPTAYEKRLGTFFSGLKRMEACKFQSGSPRESGKDPLPFSLYHELCRATLTRQDGGFAHLFLTTQWNLMCRSESVQTLCTEHLSSHDDSIGCVMYKSKTNQEAKGPKDPRHVYANPLSPETCWITALALHLACRPTQPPGPIFPGSEQKSRFGSILRQLISDLKHQTHYGTHSIRKGVATFACSGSTGGPSIASVCLRVGWSLGGVQDRYIRYEPAGDQYLGRVVAGLPLNRPEFSMLPPHFADNQHPVLCACVRQMYPSLHTISSLGDILKLCVATLVKHSVYLRDTLPASHPLLSTSLFRNAAMMSDLQAALVTGDSPWMKSTGIPPHVELYKQLQGVQKSIDNLPPVLLDGMSSLIEEKGVAAGNITKDLLETTIESLLERAGLGSGCTARVAAASPTPDQGWIGTDHCYDGKFHMLPKTFQFPKTGAFGAWMLWWFGDKARGYPPLKRIGTHDLPYESMRKTFSDWGILVRRIAEVATDAGCKIASSMTEEEAERVFKVGLDHLSLLPSTRKRRVSELSLGTPLRLARQASKKSSRSALL